MQLILLGPSCLPGLHLRICSGWRLPGLAAHPKNPAESIHPGLGHTSGLRRGSGPCHLGQRVQSGSGRGQTYPGQTVHVGESLFLGFSVHHCHGADGVVAVVAEHDEARERGNHAKPIKF